MSLAVEDPRPLEREALTEIFHRSCKADGASLIGIEHEKVSYRLSDGGPVPFRGKNSIEALLQAFCARYGWVPTLVEGAVLAATSPSQTSQITLEPGGQVELSGSPLHTVGEIAQELEQHLADLIAVASPLGIGFSSLGFHPSRRPEDVTFVPKPRYRVMREYFGHTGTRGLHMMACTATVQFNHDFKNEAEAMEKLRVGQLVSPYVSALFCNSPFEEGELSEWQSRRYFTWLDVDPIRCGLLGFAYRSDASFDDYAAWALAAPLYGIVRDGHFVQIVTQTFAQYLQRGFEGHHATQGDWIDHLGTLYPEVRLKRTIEMRGVDSGTLPHCMAATALCRGLLDDATSRREIAATFARPHDPLALQRAVAHDALLARDDEGPILGKCRWLVELASQGLKRLGETDTQALDPAREAAERGVCPADEWRETAGASTLSPLQILNKSRYLAPDTQQMIGRHR